MSKKRQLFYRSTSAQIMQKNSILSVPPVRIQKEKHFLAPYHHSFQPFTWLIKICFSFSTPRGFLASLVILMSSLLPAS